MQLLFKPVLWIRMRSESGLFRRISIRIREWGTKLYLCSTINNLPRYYLNMQITTITFLITGKNFYNNLYADPALCTMAQDQMRHIKGF
jgi:hypothetical protein